MAVKVNKEACIGCGSCAAICPGTFEIKDGKAVVKKQQKLPCEKEAAESCPVNAISV
jgi:ferredoxin